MEMVQLYLTPHEPRIFHCLIKRRYSERSFTAPLRLVNSLSICHPSTEIELDALHSERHGRCNFAAWVCSKTWPHARASCSRESLLSISTMRHRSSHSLACSNDTYCLVFVCPAFHTERRSLPISSFRHTKSSMSFTAPAALQHRRNFVRLTIVAACITLLLSWRHLGLQYRREGIVVDEEATSTHPPCWSLPGANETLVVLRTGSTEIQDRFPIHKSTSLRCFPHYMVISDVQEEFAGNHVLDALEGVNPETMALNPEFELFINCSEADELCSIPRN